MHVIVVGAWRGVDAGQQRGRPLEALKQLGFQGACRDAGLLGGKEAVGDWGLWGCVNPLVMAGFRQTGLAGSLVTD
jgi:hypothetical protein